MKYDVSVFPQFKESTLKMLDELEAVYVSKQPVEMKAKRFEWVMQAYGCA